MFLSKSQQNRLNVKTNGIQRKMENFFIALGIIAIATFIGSIGALFLKKGSAKFSIKTLFKNYKVIFGLFLYLVSTALFIPTLRLVPVSVAYPMTSLSYIWTVILSVLILKEKINTKRFLGISIIIVGIMLLGL